MAAGVLPSDSPGPRGGGIRHTATAVATTAGGLFSAARYRALTFGESIFVGNSGGNCAGSPTTYGQNLSDTEEDCFVPAYGDILLTDLHPLPPPPPPAPPLPPLLPPTPTSTPPATQQAAAPTSPPLPTSTPQPPP